MGSPTFHFGAVIPSGKGKFVWSPDPEASMTEERPGDMYFLLDRLGRGAVADSPYLWFVERTGGDEGDDGYDASYQDEDDQDNEDEDEDGGDPETFQRGDDPAEILELLDGLERALEKHGLATPFYTMFYWTNPKGERCGSTLVKGRFDGHACRLFGGWDSSSLSFLFVKPRRPALPITGDRITLEEHQDGSLEIEVERTSLADYYRPHITDIRSVCEYAIEKKCLVRSSLIP